MRALTTRAADLLGALNVALSGFLFGFIIILAKVLRDRGLPIPLILASRFIVSTVVLVLVLRGLGYPLRPCRGEGPWLIALGMFSYAMGAGLFYLALGFGQASAVALLAYTYPVFVTLGSMTLGYRRPGLLVAVALLLALSGASLIAGAPGGALSIRPAGIAAALASAVAYASYLLFSHRSVRLTHPLTGALWTSVSAGAAMLVLSFGTAQARVPGSAGEWGALAAMGVAGAAAFVFLFAGIRRIGPVRTSVLAAFEPLSATALAFAVLHEPLTAAVAGGGVLILAGATAASLARVPPPAEPVA